VVSLTSFAQAVDNYFTYVTICLGFAIMRARDEVAGPVVVGSNVPGRAFLYSDGISVDFPALHDFAITLGALASELGRRGATLTADLLDPDLADALAHAERDWSHQRLRLAAFLDGAAKSVESGLAGYEGLENELIRATLTPPAR
jgi:hypothetical protein